jgi:hypothetical protein
MKKIKKTRIHKWFSGNWSSALQGIREGEVKFKFTYNWDLDAQVQVMDVNSKTIINMNLDTFKASVKPIMKSDVYVEV